MKKGQTYATPLTLQKIRLRCVEVGDCWEWTQALHRGRPVVSEQCRTVSPRRRAWECMHGRPLPQSEAVVDKCGSITCCNPRHLFVVPRAEVPVEMARQGRAKASSDGLARRLAARRARSRLTIEQVRALRDGVARGLKVADAALQWGISETHVYRIVSGQSWKECVVVSSIFARGSA